MNNDRVATSSHPPADADADLADLLGKSKSDGSNKSSIGVGDGNDDTRKQVDEDAAASSEMESLTAAQDKMKLRTIVQDHRRVRSPSGPMDIMSAYASMLCYFYPATCGFVSIVGVFCFMLVSANYLFNPVEHYGVISHDHSNIQSAHDLEMGKIDHWCLNGGDIGCRCEDPLIPQNNAQHKSWIQALRSNRAMVKKYQHPAKRYDLDVAFIGESVVEEMGGRWMGISPQSVELNELKYMFQQRFTRRGDDGVEGVPLGIAGDTAGNVLWRLMHSEMTPEFNPRVWWISLGNNDLGRRQCSEEVTVLGILRVVEEILDKKPDARVVINSVFPMADVRGGLYPLLSDYRDSFETSSSGRRSAGAGLGPRPAAIGATSSPEDDEEEDNDRRRRLRGNDDDDGDDGDDDNAAVVKPRNGDNNNGSPERFENVVMEEERLREKATAPSRWARLLRWGRWRRRRDPANPKLLDKARVRKYNAKTAFIKPNKIPLWTSIRAINVQLRRFAENHRDRVTFFDATPVFTDRADARTETLRTDRISVRGHPTLTGYREWEDAVLKRLKLILATMKEEHPESFEPPEPIDVGIDDDYDDDDDNFDIVQEGEPFSDDEFGFTDDMITKALHFHSDDEYNYNDGIIVGHSTSSFQSGGAGSSGVGDDETNDYGDDAASEEDADDDDEDADEDADVDDAEGSLDTV